METPSQTPCWELALPLMLCPQQCTQAATQEQEFQIIPKHTSFRTCPQAGLSLLTPCKCTHPAFPGTTKQPAIQPLHIHTDYSKHTNETDLKNQPLVCWSVSLNLSKMSTILFLSGYHFYGNNEGFFCPFFLGWNVIANTSCLELLTMLSSLEQRTRWI